MEQSELQISSCVLENNFKIAQVFEMQNQLTQAINKYQEVCYSIETISKTLPDTNLEFHLLQLSLGRLCDIYKKKDDIEKAIGFVKLQKKFLEYIAVNQPIRGDSEEDFKDFDSFEQHNLNDLFCELHEVFDKPDAPPPPDSNEILKNFFEEKKQREEDTKKHNMERLLQLVEERKKRLENSRWERFLDWMNNHPVGISVALILFIGFSLVFVLIYTGNAESANVRYLRENPRHKPNFNRNNYPKSHQNRHEHISKQDIDQEINELKKAYQSNQGSQKLGELNEKYRKMAEEFKATHDKNKKDEL